MCVGMKVTPFLTPFFFVCVFCPFFIIEFQFFFVVIFFDRRTNMSSVIFQPLLHDPLGWKSSNSTYNDHFQWTKYRSNNKDKKLSTYGQQYQRQQQKQKLQQTNICLPLVTNEEETIQRVSLVNKNDDKRASSVSHRSSPLKTPPMTAVEEPPVLIAEYKQRPVSTNRVSL
jgi:hypothetical protein